MGVYKNYFCEKRRLGFLRKFNRVLCLKSNSRPKEYMKNLFNEIYPEGKFIEIDNNFKKYKEYFENNKIILLYPDSIGIGFEKIEKYLKGSKVYVLNGRKRKFKLSKGMKIRMKLRRFLERTMFLEFIFIPIFIISTAIFLFMDLLRGRL